MMVKELQEILDKVVKSNGGITDILIGNTTIDSVRLITEYNEDRQGTYIEFKLKEEIK